MDNAGYTTLTRQSGLLREMTVVVAKTPRRDPRIAVFGGTKFSTSTQLSHRILNMFRQNAWPELPEHTAEHRNLGFLNAQRHASLMPQVNRIKHFANGKLISKRHKRHMNRG